MALIVWVYVKNKPGNNILNAIKIKVKSKTKQKQRQSKMHWITLVNRSKEV